MKTMDTTPLPPQRPTDEQLSAWLDGELDDAARADVEAWKPADFYAVYIGFRCVYDPVKQR